MVDKFKRLKLVAMCCVVLSKKLFFIMTSCLTDIPALVSYGIVIYVLKLKTFWIVMLVVPGTVNGYLFHVTQRLSHCEDIRHMIKFI